MSINPDALWRSNYRQEDTRRRARKAAQNATREAVQSAWQSLRSAGSIFRSRPAICARCRLRDRCRTMSVLLAARLARCCRSDIGSVGEASADAAGIPGVLKGQDPCAGTQLGHAVLDFTSTKLRFRSTIWSAEIHSKSAGFRVHRSPSRIAGIRLLDFPQVSLAERFELAPGLSGRGQQADVILYLFPRLEAYGRVR
jgi:hypothetical protein